MRNQFSPIRCADNFPPLFCHLIHQFFCVVPSGFNHFIFFHCKLLSNNRLVCEHRRGSKHPSNQIITIGLVRCHCFVEERVFNRAGTALLADQQKFGILRIAAEGDLGIGDQ